MFTILYLKLKINVNTIFFSNLKMDYIYKLSEIVLYVVENAVISLESAQGLPLMPHGHTKRYFKLSVSHSKKLGLELWHKYLFQNNK